MGLNDASKSRRDRLWDGIALGGVLLLIAFGVVLLFAPS